MENSLFIAVSAGLAGMLGWGFADFFAKKTIDKVGDIATLAWAHVYGLVAIASFLLVRSLDSHTLNLSTLNAKEVLVLAFFGILQAFVYFFVYKGFGKGKLALLNPVFSSYSGVVVLISVLVFGEALGMHQLWLLLLIFLGIMTINVDEESIALKKLRFTRIPGMKEILIASAMATLWTVLWGHFVSQKDWLLYASIMYVFMSVTILMICLLKKIRLNVLNPETWKYFMLIGFSEVVAYIGVSFGYAQTSHVSLVAVLSAAFSVPTIILAHIFLGERITKIQKAGAALVITGVVLISLV